MIIGYVYDVKAILVMLLNRLLRLTPAYSDFKDHLGILTEIVSSSFLTVRFNQLKFGHSNMYVEKIGRALLQFVDNIVLYHNKQLTSLLTMKLANTGMDKKQVIA